MDNQRSPKDFWDKCQIVFTGIVIPVVVVAATGWLNQGLQDRQLDAQVFTHERDQRLRAFEVAVGILQQDPKNNSQTKALRAWAVDTFVQFSGKSIPAEVRRELETKPLPRPIVSSSSLLGEFVLGETLLGGPSPAK